MKRYAIFAGCMLFGVTALIAQQPANPAPGCSATPAQLAANKKLVMSFFDPTGDRVSLADPSYKQHNPAFKKRAADKGVSDYEEFKAAFGAGRQGGGRGAGNGPQPPQGNPLEVVTAECDIVTVVHKNYRQDPTADPGKFYEAFTFDTFRVKDGKLVEHWDGAVINPPVPAGRAQ
jgi:predicted SnoaL-like aldol condensation-catalyzing enzyme